MHQHDHDFESIGSIDGVVVSHVMNAAAMSVQQSLFSQQTTFQAQAYVLKTLYFSASNAS